MALSINQIQKMLSHLHQRDNRDDIQYSQYFTNSNNLYSTMAQQEYQMFQIRDFQIQDLPR